MERVLFPGRFVGEVTPPPSKSMAHRLLLGAALAAGESQVDNVEHSQDIEATLRCMEALGAKAVFSQRCCTVQGIRTSGHGETLPVFDCGESGSTLRFLIPIALAVVGGGVFVGHGRLMARPQKPYAELFAEKGIRFVQEEDKLTVEGKLQPGEYCLPGNVSSQFFTGLFYALALLDGPSVVRSTTALESRSYLTMSLRVLERFGIDWTEVEPGVFFYDGRSRYTPGKHRVEGDWSAAAFWYEANSMGSRVNILGLDENSPQGDRVVSQWVELLAESGSVVVDVRDCPDFVPALSAMAALRAGEKTEIVNAARLRIKESDRLAAVTDVLGKMGADITELPEGLVIHGKRELAGGCTISSHNDHRIAMMAAVAASRCRKPVTLTGAEAVAKSYPGFWEDYDRLLQKAVTQ